VDLLNLFKQLHKSEGKYSVDSAVEIEVEAASGHGLTSSQVNIIQDNHA
jgi:hypothetical protein